MFYTILAAIIIVIILILTLILVVPFHISIYFQKKSLKINGNVSVSWMKLRIFKRNWPEKKEDEKKEDEKLVDKEEPEKKKTKFNVRKLLKTLNLFLEALPHLERIIYAFFRSTYFEKFSLNLKLGFYSPTDTAKVAGYFWSIGSVVNVIPNVYLTFVPDFQEEIVDGNGEFEFKLRLFYIAAESIRALTKKPVRTFIRELRDFK